MDSRAPGWENHGVKARIQQWENAENSLSRKDLKQKQLQRQWLYSDSSLRRTHTTKDLRQWHQISPTQSSVERGEAKGRRRIRMSSTGSVLDSTEALTAELTQQMDDIVPGSKFDYSSDTPDYNLSWQRSQDNVSLNRWYVVRMLEDVKAAVEKLMDRDEVKNDLPRDVLDFFREWFFAEDFFLSYSTMHDFLLLSFSR